MVDDGDVSHMCDSYCCICRDPVWGGGGKCISERRDRRGEDWDGHRGCCCRRPSWSLSIVNDASVCA